MKICWWTPYATAHQTAIVTALRARGVDVEVCYFRGPLCASRRMLGWKDAPLQPWEHYARTLREARRTVPDFDVRMQEVPTFSNLTSWKLILWCVLTGRPWFAVTEGTRGRLVMRPLFRTFCWFLDRFALRLYAEGGPGTVRQYVAAGVRPEKVTQFCYATTEGAERSGKAERDEAGTVFVFAGEFCRRKAVDVIASAWRRLRTEFPSVRLIVAGAGELAEVWDDSVERVGALPQERIYEVIGRGDVMLLPSRYDAWGAALAEGGMAGLAMIGSDRTGAADLLIEDGVTGLKVRAGDADDLLRAMRVYAADRNLARSHGRAARRAAVRTTGKSLAEALVAGLPDHAPLFYCPGFGDGANGMSVVATFMLKDPAWENVAIVHGAWLWRTWWACLRFGRYVRMTHGAYDPVRVAYHGWKKRLVGPVDRFFLRRADRVLVTCPAEAAWVRAYEPRVKSVECVDLRRYFALEPEQPLVPVHSPLRLLYLGRNHPLKGIGCLRQAVAEAEVPVDLRVVSDAFGTEKDALFAWCDALVLPTLTENFGLVVAEALAHGRRVVTTDGAPAWRGETHGGRLTYLEGYREGDDATRVRLLREAIRTLAGGTARS